MGCGCKTISVGAAPRTFFVEPGAVREVTGLLDPKDPRGHVAGGLAEDAPVVALGVGAIVGAILMGKAVGWMGVALVGGVAIPLVLLWHEKQRWTSTALVPASGQTAP